MYLLGVTPLAILHECEYEHVCVRVDSSARCYSCSAQLESKVRLLVNARFLIPVRARTGQVGLQSTKTPLASDARG